MDRHSYTKVYYLSHLFNIVFLVAVPCYSICRKMHFVAGDPSRASSVSLCFHRTNRVYCTHINLKIVCSVCSCLSTPRSVSPDPIQPAIVWIIINIVVWACRHSGIWYCVPVLYTNSSTFWKTHKQTNLKKKKTSSKKYKKQANCDSGSFILGPSSRGQNHPAEVCSQANDNRAQSFVDKNDSKLSWLIS